MTAFEGVREKLHTFLTSVLDGGEQSLFSFTLYPHGTNWLGDGCKPEPVWARHQRETFLPKLMSIMQILQKVLHVHYMDPNKSYSKHFTNARVLVSVCEATDQYPTLNIVFLGISLARLNCSQLF